jgi:probable HAF family extracellular repeat protein
MSLLSGFSSGGPNDINNKSQVVGTSWGHSRASYHGTLWDNGAPTDLGSLPGFGSSELTAVNDAGRVVGFAWSPGGTARRAFIR